MSVSKEHFVGHIIGPNGKPQNVEFISKKRPDLTEAERSAGITWVDNRYLPYYVLRYGPNTTPGTTHMGAIINSAIDAASAAGGGTVKLEAGVVHAVDPSIDIIIMKSNVTLDLCGATIQRIGSNSTLRMIENDDYALSSTDENIHVISTGATGKIIGTGSSTAVSDQGSCIGWFGLNEPWSVRNIETDESNGDGLSYRNVGSGVLEDFTAKSFGRNGISPTSNRGLVHWRNVDVQGPAISGANPGIGIDAENDSATESTNHVWLGVRSSIGMTFVDFFTASGGNFSHKVQMDACEWGPAFNALKIRSVNDTVAQDFVIGSTCIGSGSGLSGAAVVIDNVSGVIDKGSKLDCSTGTGSPVGIFVVNTVDDLTLNGTKVTGASFGIQSFLATDVLTNSRIHDCSLGAVYLTGNDNHFYNSDITTLTISRAASIDNKFIHSTPTSITEANSGDEDLNQFVIESYLQTATADDTTPSVLRTGTLVTPANTVATAITQLDDAYNGQEVTLVCNSSTNSSTITDSGNFSLSADWTPNLHDTLTVVLANGVWREVARSTN